MSEVGPSRFSFRIILGTAAIVLGAALLLDNLEMLPSYQVFRWWPLLLLALAAGRFLDRGVIWSTGGHVLLWIGVLGLLGESGHDELIQRWWPLILVYFGVLVAIRSFVPKPPKPAKLRSSSQPKETQP